MLPSWSSISLYRFRNEDALARNGLICCADTRGLILPDSQLPSESMEANEVDITDRAPLSGEAAPDECRFTEGEYLAGWWEGRLGESLDSSIGEWLFDVAATPPPRRPRLGGASELLELAWLPLWWWYGANGGVGKTESRISSSYSSSWTLVS